jgi:hypothetical protein
MQMRALSESKDQQMCLNQNLRYNKKVKKAIKMIKN